MGIIKIVEWETSICKSITNVLIFKFIGILVTIWLLFFIAYMYIACMCFSITLNNATRENASKVN